MKRLGLAMVERDGDADNSSATGNYGTSGSGLEERLYAQQDANYNTTALVTASGTVAERYVYDPYGAVTVLDASGTPRPGNTSSYGWLYLHQGGCLDTANGTYDFRNRIYSPTLGRWMQMDPAGCVDGTNQYQAELSAPVSRQDPRGLTAATPSTQPTDSVTGTPEVGKTAEFKSARGVTVTVEVYKNGIMTITNDDQTVRYHPDVTFLAKSKNPAEEKCDDIHFVQFIARNEIRKPTDPPYPIMIKSGGLYHYPGKYDLDAVGDNPFYDRPPSLHLRLPGLVAIGDHPGINAELSAQYFKAKVFVVSGHEVKWLFEWGDDWDAQGKKTVTVGKSEAVNDFGEFNTPSWQKGFKDDSVDQKTGIDPQTVRNPFFVEK